MVDYFRAAEIGVETGDESLEAEPAVAADYEVRADGAPQDDVLVDGGPRMGAADAGQRQAAARLSVLAHDATGEEPRGLGPDGQRTALCCPTCMYDWQGQGFRQSAGERGNRAMMSPSLIMG